MDAVFTTVKPKRKRWYQEPWMLLVLGGPLIVIVASIYTAFLAYKGADHVIAPDYYKRGLAINQDIRRDLAARERGLEGALQIDDSTHAVKLKLAGKGELPATLTLNLSRAAGKGNEEFVFKVPLVESGGGVYLGKLSLPAELNPGEAAMWQVRLEGDDWRLASVWYGPLHAPVAIKPAS